VKSTAAWVTGGVVVVTLALRLVFDLVGASTTAKTVALVVGSVATLAWLVVVLRDNWGHNFGPGDPDDYV
jgi:hypothetical protein